MFISELVNADERNNNPDTKARRHNGALIASSVVNAITGKIKPLPVRSYQLLSGYQGQMPNSDGHPHNFLHTRHDSVPARKNHSLQCKFRFRNKPLPIFNHVGRWLTGRKKHTGLLAPLPVSSKHLLPSCDTIDANELSPGRP